MWRVLWKCEGCYRSLKVLQRCFRVVGDAAEVWSLLGRCERSCGGMVGSGEVGGTVAVVFRTAVNVEGCCGDV